MITYQKDTDRVRVFFVLKSFFVNGRFLLCLGRIFFGEKTRDEPYQKINTESDRVKHRVEQHGDKNGGGASEGEISR